MGDGVGGGDAVGVELGGGNVGIGKGGEGGLEVARGGEVEGWVGRGRGGGGRGGGTGIMRTGISPDVVSYAIAISACVMLSRPEEAAALFDEMGEHGMPEAEQTCNRQVVLALAGGGRWRRAFSLLRDMRRSSKMEGSLACYNAVLGACVDARELEKAWMTFRQIRRVGLEPSGRSYALVLRALAAAGKWKQAVALLGEMRAAGAPRTERTFAAALKACARAENWGASLEVLREMRREGIKPDAYSYNSVSGIRLLPVGWG